MSAVSPRAVKEIAAGSRLAKGDEVDKCLSQPPLDSPKTEKRKEDSEGVVGLRRERTQPRKQEQRSCRKSCESSCDHATSVELVSVATEIVLEEEGETKAENKEEHDSPVAEAPYELIADFLDCCLNDILRLTKETPVAEARQVMEKLERLTRGDRASLVPGLSYFLQRLYERMEADENDDALHERAIYLIGKLAREAKWISATVAETGGIKIVVDMMTKHQHSAVIQERVVATLLHLTTTEKARISIVSEKGAESVCWAMKEFIEVRNIQVQGSTSLCNMAFGNTTSKKRIGKVGGIDGVVRAMEHHASDAELQARCCLALRNLTCGSRVNQWIAGRAKAMEAIVDSVKSLPQFPDVQYQGCVALANLCTEEPDNRIRAVDCGVIELVIPVLRANPENASMAEHILGLLRCLLHDSKESQKLVAEEDGVVLVVSALRQHVLHENVLKNGCEVIRYLMFTAENRMAMYNCGGLEVLVRVLREGNQWKSVAESCLYALGNSAYDFIESKIAIGRHGGIAILIDCMSAHMDCSIIQEHGCRALRNIADSDDLNIMLLSESGAVNSCIFACSGYPENAQIQEHALAMLYNMTFNDEHLRRMKGLDIDRVLAHAKLTHTSNLAVQSQATALQSKIETMEGRNITLKAKAPFNLASFARISSSSLSRKASKVVSGSASPKTSSYRRGYGGTSDDWFRSTQKLTQEKLSNGLSKNSSPLPNH